MYCILVQKNSVVYVWLGAEIDTSIHKITIHWIQEVSFGFK